MAKCKSVLCPKEAQYVFYDPKEAGYPTPLCKEHLDLALEDYYDVLVEKKTMKQDKAYVKVELMNDNQCILVFFAVLEENGFAEFTEEYDINKAVRITLSTIERDRAHDYEKEMELGMTEQ